MRHGMDVLLPLVAAFVVGACEWSGQTSGQHDNALPPPGMIDTTEFAFSRVDACESSEHDPYTNPDAMMLNQQNGRLVATILSGTSCGWAASDPRVEYESGRVTLLVSDVDLVPDAEAACLCSDRLTFELKREVPSGTPILFVRSGTATAQGIAP